VTAAIDMGRGAVLERLADVCQSQGADPVAAQLDALRSWMGADLVEVERALCAVDARDTTVCNSARHLLAYEGKRLRPLCVALAARVGEGFGPEARELAVAVELVHSATLLHDDVVDLGDERRGAKTARLIYGNAGSIFGGDWLLVEALGCIRRANVPLALERMLDVLREMLFAESLQLDFRGKVGASTADYFRVVEGKTASLFRWALDSGGRAGKLEDPACDALGRFGHHLGTAFQLIDDVLDVAGNPSVVGKRLFADLHEGKMTYPLLLAVSREKELAELLERCLKSDEPFQRSELERSVTAALHRTGALAESMQLAHTLSETAVKCLDDVPRGEARDALAAVATAIVSRRK